MNAPCYQHPLQFATATCAECERPICVQCTQTVANRPVCAPCVAAIRSRVGGELNAQAGAPLSASTPSAIPMNVPRPASGIPINVPRSNAPGVPPAVGAPTYQGMPAAQPLGAGQAPLNPAPPQPLYAPAPAQPLYSPAPAPPLYSSPGSEIPQAPPVSAAPPLYGQTAPGTAAPPLYGQPMPAPPAQQPYGQPPSYGQNTAYGQQPYAPPAGYNPAGYGQPANGQRPLPSQSGVSAGLNITLAVVIGVVLILVVGVGFGFAAVAMGGHIPLLSILVGLIVGHAVKAASGGTGPGVGVIGAVCSLLTCLVTYGVIVLNGYLPSPVALLLMFYATWRGYRIGAGESNY